MRTRFRRPFLLVGLAAVALAAAVPALASRSLYQAPLTFRTDAGETVTLEKWKGERVVLTMVFTSCQATCPLTMSKLREIQAQFDREQIDAHVVVVSFDPARGTPEKLAAYRKATDHTRPNWTFLVGSEEDTRTLAMLLGIKYSRNPTTGDIMHDNKIVLLNGEGEITKELLGLNASIADFR
jgi:protein SCO1/2